MAALSVAARGAVVTGALDRQSGTYSRNVVVPLFSIAEWLVTNWWHLWYEVGDISEPPPAFEAGTTWRSPATGSCCRVCA